MTLRSIHKSQHCSENPPLNKPLHRIEDQIPMDKTTYCDRHELDSARFIYHLVGGLEHVLFFHILEIDGNSNPN